MRTRDEMQAKSKTTELCVYWI